MGAEMTLHAKSSGLALACVCVAARAADPGIEGRWATLDDETHKTRAVIEIRAQGADIVGRIVEFHPRPGEDANPLCDACKGADRGKPIRGLEILHLAPEADSKGWTGTVLDPDEGDVYRARARLEDGGRRLALRGYVLLPVFGRSETWTRVP